MPVVTPREDEPMAAQPRSLTIAALTYGPHGLGRLDGKAIFVRGVVPGETVEVAIREDHGSYAFADLVGVRRAAAERRTPPCAYLPRCGGCPWQHVEYAAQLDAKARNVGDALTRIGGLPAAAVRPILASPEEFGYRSRVTLRVAGRRIGFYAAASHELVPIEACLLAAGAVGRALPAAADLIRRLASPVRRIEVAAGEVDDRVVLAGEVEGGCAGGDAGLVEAWLRGQPAIAGVVLHGRRWRRAWGDVTLTLRPEPDLVLRAHAGAFTQVSAAGNRLLVRTLLESGGFAPGERVLDVYAGVGNLGLPVARRTGRAVLVERDAVGAADARANVAALGLRGCEVRTAAAQRAVSALRRAGERFDAVILDPPRSGAADLIDDLLALSPPRLFYVSCNPASLARDLRRLSGRYRVETVQPIDLFPHTYHVETVVRAVLTC